MKFEISASGDAGPARTGQLAFPHAAADTPVFMPVGTAASVKMLTPEMVAREGASTILANTYHLMIRPGTDVIADLGGLHAFSGWDKLILTDSGGFQVFSLAALNQIDDNGVRFRSHVDGAEIYLTPESVMEAQAQLGSDIAMVLDECPPADAERSAVEAAVERTVRWARRSLDAPHPDGQAVFAIVQGGRFTDLRTECTQRLVEMDFPGYAIGGLSVGEERSVRRDILAASAELLPADKPRYVMGIGEPVDILDAVGCGCDMFDCVLPTRNGRNGTALTMNGKVNIRNSCHIRSAEPIDAACGCYACSKFSRGYIRHLFNVNEALGPMLVSIHNIRFFMDFMQSIRNAVQAGEFAAYRSRFMDMYYQGSVS